MNNNPLRWKSRKRIKYREGEKLYMIINVKSDCASLAGMIWGHMKLQCELNILKDKLHL